MILFKIYPQRLTLLPLKGDTPWAVDVDTVTFRYSLIVSYDHRTRHIGYESVGSRFWMYSSCFGNRKLKIEN